MRASYTVTSEVKNEKVYAEQPKQRRKQMQLSVVSVSQPGQLDNAKIPERIYPKKRKTCRVTILISLTRK